MTMSLPLLYKTPETDDDWRSWTFNHAALHYNVIGAVAQQKSTILVQFMLDPMSRDDPGLWLYRHQVMHNQVNAVLQTKLDYDLLAFDWEDPDQLAMWLQQNGDEHQQWSQILGVE
jgi:hypothetical protein